MSLQGKWVQQVVDILGEDQTIRSKPIRLYGAVAKLYEIGPTADELMLWGAADTGKTIGSLLWINDMMWEHPGAQAAIVRKSYRSMPGTVLETFHKKILPYPLGDARCPIRAYGGVNRPERYIYPNGSVIWLGGMDNPEKVLSSERDIIYVNQAEELGLPDWEILGTRATGRAMNMPFSLLFGDCNPGPPTHWIKRRGDKGTLLLLEALHIHNPELYNQETGEITIAGESRLRKLKKSLSGSRLMRLYHGRWVQPEGAIYDMFDEDLHSVPHFVPSTTWPTFVGVDPFGAYVSAVFVAFDPQEGRVHVFDEYYKEFGITTTQHVQNMLTMMKQQGRSVFRWVGGGPSERQARADFTGAGIPLIGSPITDVWIGIDKVIELLNNLNLVIHDNCMVLLSEIGEYKRKMKDGVPTDTIEDKDRFHMLDSLRYVISFLTYTPETEDEIVYNPIRI